MNTRDGAAGHDYENVTNVGMPTSEESARTSGKSLYGNLIEQASPQDKPGNAGPNENFVPRGDQRNRGERQAEQIGRSAINKMRSTFDNPTGLGGTKEQYSDKEGEARNIDYIGKYSESNKRWSDQTQASVDGGTESTANVFWDTVSQFVPPIIKRKATDLAGYDSKQKFGPKSNKFPADWKEFDLTYDYGGSVEKFDADGTSPWEQTLPMIITDMRSNQKVYIRAFLEALSERYTPDWQSFQVFGRPEPFHQWKSCTRNITLRFNMVAFSAPELQIMFKKLNFLTQLQYATYDDRGRPASPPLCRLLIGDLIKPPTNQSPIVTNALFGALESLAKSIGLQLPIGSGLPGFINGLNVEYDHKIWEMESGSKVPRKLAIDINFVVVNEAFVDAKTSFYDQNIGNSNSFKSAYYGVGNSWSDKAMDLFSSIF